MRALAWCLFTAAFVSLIAVLGGFFPPFTLVEYIPMALGALGIVSILIHDTRKDQHR